MKTIKYIILSIAIISVISCGNSWLDLEPSTQIPTNSAIQNLSHVDYSLNSIYNEMRNAYYYSGRMTYYGDVTGDDVQANGLTKRTASYYLMNMTKDTGPSTHWSYAYTIIRNCNIILEQIENIEYDAKDQSTFDNLKGQALTLRGMALFELTRFFGYPYTKDNGASLGVPIVNTVTTVDSKPARNTVAECYKAFISDFEQAIILLSENFNKGKVNKWTAMGYLSRAYLYMGKNQDALETAKATIEGAEKNKYALWKNEEYPTIWGSDSEASKPGEILFEMVNTTTESAGKETMGHLCYSKGYSDMILTSSFFKMLNEDSKDVRNKLYLVISKKAYINKYQPQQGETMQDANIPVMRLSEIYLIAAEAAVKLNNNETAIKYLNPIVQRANPQNNVEEEVITLDRVLDERRKELFGEGHRMFDAIRNHKTIERKNESISTISSTKHYELLPESKSFDWNYFRIVLPIPKAEINSNPQIVQNPGYGN